MSIYQVERVISAGKAVIVGSLGKELSQSGLTQGNLEDKDLGSFSYMVSREHVQYIHEHTLTAMTRSQTEGHKPLFREAINSSDWKHIIRYHPRRFMEGKKILFGRIMPF